MFRMAVGHSDDVDLASALEVAFAECEAGLAGAAPNAGLLMSAWGVDHQTVIDQVRARYPGIELAGMTCAGEMSSVLGFREDSVALALFASDLSTSSSGSGATSPRIASLRPGRRSRRPPPRRGSRPGCASCCRPSAAWRRASSSRPSGRPLARASRSSAAGRHRAIPPPNSTAGAATSSPATSSRVTPWRSSCSRARLRSRSASRPAGSEWVHGRRSRERQMPGCSRSTAGPPSSSTSAYVGTGRPPVANPLAVFEESGSDRFYLRTPTMYDQEHGSIGFFGAVPEGAIVQLTVAGTDQIFAGAKASISDALARFPAGAQPGGCAPLRCATRKFLLGTRAGREIVRPRGPRGCGADRRLLRHGPDRPDRIGRPVAHRQRHDGVRPARVRPARWAQVA